LSKSTFSNHISSPVSTPPSSNTSSYLQQQQIPSQTIQNSIGLSTNPSSPFNSLSQGLGMSISTPTPLDDPILPYVGNIDLENGCRGSKRFARMPGGMRIPLKG